MRATEYEVGDILSAGGANRGGVVKLKVLRKGVLVGSASGAEVEVLQRWGQPYHLSELRPAWRTNAEGDREPAENVYTIANKDLWPWRERLAEVGAEMDARREQARERRTRIAALIEREGLVGEDRAEANYNGGRVVLDAAAFERLCEQSIMGKRLGERLEQLREELTMLSNALEGARGSSKSEAWRHARVAFSRVADGLAELGRTDGVPDEVAHG